MLRWTVRALGSHDPNPRLSCHFSFQTLRLLRSHSSRTHANAPVEESNTSVTALSFAESPTRPQGTLCLSSRPSTRHLDPGRATCCQSSHFTIDILRRYLSLENITSDHPLICSPATIRSLYYRAESRNQLTMLDFKMLTLLMGLFGSLSIDPCISVVYRIPLASRLLAGSRRRTHWAFVLKVGKYKLERGMSLQDSDRFWLMCAELAIQQAKPPLESLSDDAYSAILRARTHYHIIRRHSRRPEVHAYYLEALLAIRDPRLLDFAACDLSFVLRTHRLCHPRLQSLLYRLVIQHGSLLSTRSQEAILSALWSRVCQGTDGISNFVTEDGLSDMTLDNCVSDVTATATAIARSLSVTLFGFAGHLPSDKSANSVCLLFSVFSPAHALPLRWGSLILLSTFNSPEMLHLNRTRWTGERVMPQITSCWQVIFGLATVEKISQELPALVMQPTLTEGVLEITRSLYQLWSAIMKSSLVSRDLVCVVATSFLKIASVLADATLFYDCQDLYRVEDSLDGPRTSLQKLFAAQYIGAAVRVQGPLPDVVLAALEACSSDLKQQHQILSSAVGALAPIDPSLAYTLYTIAQKRETELDPEAAHTLAMSFAQRGALHQAILFLNDSRFSLEKRGILVSTIARSLRADSRTRHPRSVFVAIAYELADLYYSHIPPEHFQGHLEQLFVILARHGRGRQLFPVVLSILGRLPSFFQPGFFVRYCRALIQHRQFATASKLLDTITTVHPKVARSLCVLTDRIAVQNKTFRVSKRIAPSRGPTSLRISSRLWRCPYAGPPLERSLQELLRSGRLLAAKHIFACAVATIPSARCTALGNILLHGVSRQPAPRNGRRVRKVLALLESLVKNHGFRPDRVTANILIKAMIDWRPAFNSPRLRELFDQLVRGGHPAADYSPPHPPFGTQQIQFSGSSGFSKLSSFVSFERHSRPLFKMFIKAFYLCNDVEAARKVVGILKVEEYRNAMAKEVRQRARTRGRKRNLIPLDATAPRIG